MKNQKVSFNIRKTTGNTFSRYGLTKTTFFKFGFFLKINATTSGGPQIRAQTPSKKCGGLAGGRARLVARTRRALGQRILLRPFENATSGRERCQSVEYHVKVAELSLRLSLQVKDTLSFIKTLCVYIQIQKGPRSDSAFAKTAGTCSKKPNWKPQPPNGLFFKKETFFIPSSFPLPQEASEGDVSRSGPDDMQRFTHTPRKPFLTQDTFAPSKAALTLSLSLDRSIEREIFAQL